MFNAIRDDAGEFRFFMVQPLVITFEDLMQWCWRRFGFAKRHPRMGQAIGYAWTFVWFSYCLPPFVHSQRAVEIMGEDFAGDWASELGQKHFNDTMITVARYRPD
jgi:hypothetical protein